jgi:ribosomal protein L7/L12
MIRQPTEEEHARITGAVLGGDRIEATTLYISITGCGLTEAQEFVRTLTAELKESTPARFVRKKQGKSHWVRLSIP